MVARKTKDLTFDKGRVLFGSCLDRLKDLADESIDSIVTDPPYELGFMGKKWDASGIAYNVELWKECLRVLKPGGHLLAFGGTRTYHRMTVAIEDAGFEIRDSIHWVYGSGFPKSLDVSKAIDKQRYEREDIYKVTAWVRAARDAAGISNKDIDNAFGANGMGRHWTDVPPTGKQPAVPTLDQIPTLLEVLGVNDDAVPVEIRRLIWDLNGMKGKPGPNWAKREVVGSETKARSTASKAALPTVGGKTVYETWDITVPATDAAKQWSGWGTALKPAHEPIVLARKPLTGTVAQNVQEHGTGAINIDGCRIGNETVGWQGSGRNGESPTAGASNGGQQGGYNYKGGEARPVAGRWPANIIFDEAAGAELDEQSGIRTSGLMKAGQKTQGYDGPSMGNWKPGEVQSDTYADSGGASRFFYCPKPGKKERNAGLDTLKPRFAPTMGDGIGVKEHNPETETKKQNFHPTVKPVELMRYLCRLITPPGGTVLDPFLGSGTTAVAATLEKFDWVGCEMTKDYLPIIKGRVNWAQKQQQKLPGT